MSKVYQILHIEDWMHNKKSSKISTTYFYTLRPNSTFRPKIQFRPKGKQTADFIPVKVNKQLIFKSERWIIGQKVAFCPSVCTITLLFSVSCNNSVRSWHEGQQKWPCEGHGVKQKVSISLAVVVILLTIIWFLNIFFMIIIVTGRVVLNIYVDLHYLFGGCCAAIWLGI